MNEIFTCEGDPIKRSDVLLVLDITNDQLVTKIENNEVLKSFNYIIKYNEPVKPKQIRNHKPKVRKERNTKKKIPIVLLENAVYEEKSFERGTYDNIYFLDGYRYTLREMGKKFNISHERLRWYLRGYLKSCTIQGYNLTIERRNRGFYSYTVEFFKGVKHSKLKGLEVKKLLGNRSCLNVVTLEKGWVYAKEYRIKKVINNNFQAEILINSVLEFWSKEEILAYLEGLQ